MTANSLTVNSIDIFINSSNFIEIEVIDVYRNLSGISKVRGNIYY